MFVLSALCMALPALGGADGYSILASLYAFEFLCGVFWPSKGILKSQYVPEEVRATMYNTFRVPLNLIVCLVLSNLDKTSDEAVFSIVCALLLSAAVMQHVSLSCGISCGNSLRVPPSLPPSLPPSNSPLSSSPLSVPCTLSPHPPIFA